MADSPWKIPLSDLEYGAEEEEAVLRVIRSKWLTQGPETQKFEEEFAAYLGVEKECVVAVSSATAALHLGMLTLSISEEAEVIQPALNFVALANITSHLGAVPMFADIESLSAPFTSLEHSEKLLTPKTKVLAVMAYGGIVPAMDRYRDFCTAHDLLLIEDACHALGADYQGKRIGTWGDMAAFSFYSNKNMSVGEGGMLVTRDPEIAAQARQLRSHGMTRRTWERHQGGAAGYDITAAGLNYRIDEIRSALGRIQLAKLNQFNEKRREKSLFYDSTISNKSNSDNKNWELPGGSTSTERAASACHIYPLLAKSKNQRDQLAAALNSEKIQTSHHYPLVPGFEHYLNRLGINESELAEHWPISADFTDREITLPLWPGITREQIKQVVSVIDSKKIS
jgi:dTDP-4-amino-4,6-dideoxygalactose transaminase